MALGENQHRVNLDNQIRGNTPAEWLAAVRSTIAKMSLGKRMFILSALVLLVFLSIASLVLRTAFWISLENVVQEKLSLHTYQLLSLGDTSDTSIRLPQKTSEPRFNDQQGELIAFVTELISDNEQQEVWRSLSASNKKFSFPVPDSGKWLFGRARGPNGAQYYVSSFNTTWTNNNGVKAKYVFTIMENFGYYEKQVSNYRTSITVGLLVFGLVFLLLQMLILRFGLSPVKKITVDVEQMNKGESAWLDGQYPQELMPLTVNLNRLVDNERLQRERYRERMADLSHGLKTPLSVLRGLGADIDDHGQPISRENLLETLTKQVSRMSKLVDYQLQRTIPSGAPTVLTKVDIAVTAKETVSALDKVYLDKNIHCKIDVESGLYFYGDENDLIEMIGNLLDNAYKHASDIVRFSALNVSMKSKRSELIFMIEDDGTGVPPTKRETILERGVQLDSSGDGQGFGLSIVADIVRSYQGTLAIRESMLGGALFEIKIPST